MGILVFWLLLCILPAAIASSKGRSAVGWFLIGIIISPLLAAILVALLSSPAVEDRRHLELLEAARGGSRATATEPTSPSADPVALLARLAELRDSGAISPEEFETKKAELLARV